MMTIDVSVNEQQIAYITILNKVQTPSGLCEYEVRLLDDENPSSAKAVRVSHMRPQSYLTLLKKVFTKLEESK